MRYLLLFSMLIAAIGLQNCAISHSSLSLKLPLKELEVVQYIPASKEGRNQNTLYLPPRKVKKGEFNTARLNDFIDTLYRVMVKKSGVGIAANQIGKRLQIFIIEAKLENPRYKVLGTVPKQIFINPMITKVSAERKNFWHGCLSGVGENRGNVATYEWIEYRCQNIKGEIQEGRLDGFAAVIFQHEFKHLMTGTYLDVAHQFLPKGELDQKIASGELPFFEMASDTLPLLIQGYTIGKTLDEYHGR